jgi:hypothetical protein
VQQQYRAGRDVWISRRRAFPQVRPVLDAVRRFDTGLFEQLPNKLAALRAVIIKGDERVIM